MKALISVLTIPNVSAGPTTDADAGLSNYSAAKNRNHYRSVVDRMIRTPREEEHVYVTAERGKQLRENHIRSQMFLTKKETR